MRRVAVAGSAALLAAIVGCSAGADRQSPAPSAASASTLTSTSTSAGSAAPRTATGSGSPAPASSGSGVPTGPPQTTFAPSVESPQESPEPAPTSARASPPETGFTSSIAAIDAAVAARMESSWRPGCPVPPNDLRYLTLTYHGFDGADHTGELVVAGAVAEDVVAIFRQLYQDGYPIAAMRLVDDFGGDDGASMAANNTSAFNCRPVTGGGGFSEHSYGTAIDVNPVQNPYLSGSTVLPAAGEPYVDRPDAPGVIHDGDGVVVAFAAHGFSWGGDWSGPIDYQHFSLSGR